MSPARALPVETWPRHRIYGLTLASDFPFASRMAPGAGAPDVVFTCGARPPLALEWEGRTPAYASSARRPDGRSLSYFYRHPAFDIVRVTDRVDFYLGRDAIHAHLLDPQAADLMEVYLLGMVLACWLERAGIVALHASAAVVEDTAVAFLSSKHGGKSSLAAALAQAGCPLLTDDILPVEVRAGSVRARPGYPQMRLWPEEAAHFLGRHEHLPRAYRSTDKRRVPVGPDGLGSFCDRPHPLARLYLPERRVPDDRRLDVEIVPVAPGEALLALVRDSFMAHLTHALGWQPQRLQVLAGMVRRAPVRRLVYPAGLQHLARVRDAILADG